MNDDRCNGDDDDDEEEEEEEEEEVEKEGIWKCFWGLKT